MSSNVPRTRLSKNSRRQRKEYTDATRSTDFSYTDFSLGETVSKLWISEGHPINRKTGKREGGGPFHVTHQETFAKPADAPELCKGTGASEKFYRGILMPAAIQDIPSVKAYYNGSPQGQDVSSLNSLGTTAIAQCAPTNPSSSLGTSLAESFREGVPSLPGIQLWKNRTEKLVAAGSEYLNYQFGWAPLQNEVNSVVNTARNHRDILQNYRHNEGRDVHRRFDFPTEIQEVAEPSGTHYIGENLNNLAAYASVAGATPATCQTVFRKETKRWFEGCFTFGGMSGTDSFRRQLGFGSDADALFGLSLTPSVLWELTPWSWAVDWFSNTGDVITNATNFGAAGLVMRYGFMMQESIVEYYTEFSGQRLRAKVQPNTYVSVPVGPAKRGERLTTKSRAIANPFGFGVGWEGLSPTQLAITAALGITRLL
jgi:hypothetical protein